MNLKNMAIGLYRKVSQHSPAILTGLGVAGFFTAIVLAVKATPKAEALIIEAEDEKEDRLTIAEMIKSGWKPYAPAAVTALASSACIFGAVKIQHDRQLELAGAYALSQAMVKRYREKTEEIAGKEKADEIDSAVQQETVRSPMVQKAVSNLPPTNRIGLHPFVSILDNSAFYATTEMLQKAEVALNRRIFTSLEPYVTGDDLCDELNEQGVYPKLKHSAVTSMIGWTAENGGIEFNLDVDGIPLEQSHWDDGTPCYVMSFKRYREPVSIL